MIDDEQDVCELIKAMNQHLPIPAYATPQLVKAIRQEGAKINVNDPVTIDSVMYLGDNGGIGCSTGEWGGSFVSPNVLADEDEVATRNDGILPC